MNKITITGNSVALSANGLANDVGAATPGTTLFVLAANDAADDLAHKIIITPSASVTGNYVLTGLGPNGQVQTETLATNTTNAVTSAKYYSSLTSVKSPSGLSTNTVDIGWTAASVSPWKYLLENASGMGFAAIVDSGSPTYSVQYTYDGGVTAFDHSAVASETTSQAGAYGTQVQAVRLSWVAAGEVTLHGIEGYAGGSGGHLSTPVSVDQTTPGTTNKVTEASSYVNLSASAQVKAGAGTLVGIFVASASATPTVKVWAQTTAAVPILVNTFTPAAGTFYPMPAKFAAGLYVTISGTVDLTVFYD